MKFSAKDEPMSFELLPEGDYEFEVEDAVIQTAKRGGFQWRVTLRIDPEGRTASRKVWEYFPETEKMQWKFASFLKCVGLIPAESEDEFDTELMQDAVGQIGKCRIGVQESDGTWPAKNIVKAFHRPEAEETPEAPKAQEEPKKGKAKITNSSDDLPF